MSQPIPANAPRSYLHHACGQVTIMPDEVIRKYLHNPDAYSETTFCAACRQQVPDVDCTLVETGENLRSHMEWLQKDYDQRHRMSNSGNSGVNLKPGGIRKLLAIALFVLTVIIPVQSLWKEGNLDPAPARGLPVFPRGGRQVESAVKTPWYLWPLAILGGIFSLALYCPNWGYKRYALLCGPVAAIGTLMFLNYWLTGRTVIYRTEVILVAMAGALPGIAVWVLLILRKAQYRRLA